MRAWCHALPRMRAFSPASKSLPVCSHTVRASRPRRALPGVIRRSVRDGARERSQGERGIPEPRSPRICRESPLTGGSATLAREETAARFPLPHGEWGVGAEGSAPYPRWFWGCRPAAFFFPKRAKRAWGLGAATGQGNAPGKGVATRRAARLSVRRALRRSTRLYEVKGSVLPFISREAIV